MSRKIIAGITIALSILCGTIAAYAIGEGISNEGAPVAMMTMEKPEEIIKEFEVKEIRSFKDDVSNLTLEEISNEINNQKKIQESAHSLAEHARSLGWPEDCQAIESAGNEWLNAQKAIVFYQNAYDEKFEEQEQTKWKQKKSEFPVATEIWLYMKDLGWNDYVCAGILGNIMAEVGGQTLNIQPYLKGNGYYGMCQWNKGYSSIWGGSLKQQCDYLRDTIKQEFNTFGYVYQSGFNYNSFLSLQNARHAAKAFAKCYERCGSSSYRARENNAEVAYNYFVS